jgi:hypothetical protein
MEEDEDFFMIEAKPMVILKTTYGNNAQFKHVSRYRNEKILFIINPLDGKIGHNNRVHERGI